MNSKATMSCLENAIGQTIIYLLHVMSEKIKLNARNLTSDFCLHEKKQRDEGQEGAVTAIVASIFPP